MNIKQAFEILKESAKSDIRGSGCGSRHTVPTGKKLEEIKDAIAFAELYVAKHNRCNRSRWG